MVTKNLQRTTQCALRHTLLSVTVTTYMPPPLPPTKTPQNQNVASTYGDCTSAATPGAQLAAQPRRNTKSIAVPTM